MRRLQAAIEPWVYRRLLLLARSNSLTVTADILMP
jgi:hypothetical protein